MRSRILMLLLAWASFACVTRGKDFPSDVNWIKTNGTKQGDVAQLLGQPYQVGNAGGTPTWTYGYYKFRLFGDSNTKELKLWWNTDKTVKYFSFSSSFPADKGKSIGGAAPQGSAGAAAPSRTPSYEEYPIN